MIINFIQRAYISRIVIGLRVICHTIVKKQFAGRLEAKNLTRARARPHTHTHTYLKSVVFPLLTLNYSTTRRPGEDFIKIARVVIAVVQSQRTGGRKANGGERERETLKFAPRSLRDDAIFFPRCDAVFFLIWNV